MNDTAERRLTCEVTMGEIERAIGTQNYEFKYSGGALVGIHVEGQTLTPEQVLQKIDAMRGAKE